MPKDADFNSGENKGITPVTAYSNTLPQAQSICGGMSGSGLRLPERKTQKPLKAVLGIRQELIAELKNIQKAAHSATVTIMSDFVLSE